MSDYIVLVILFLGITAFFTWKSLRLKGSGWSGTVESVTRTNPGRKFRNDVDGGEETKAIQSSMADKIIITCRLDDGSQKTIKLQALGIKRLFPDGIEQGDRLTKVTGSYDYRLDRRGEK